MTLSAYVVRDVVKPTALALGFMLGLVWLLQSLHFLDLVINKGLEIWIFLDLTLMLVPQLLTLILPISLFVGACVVLRRWQEDNELTAVLSLGRSPCTVLYPLLGWAVVTVVFSYILFLDLLPRSTSEFKNLQYQIRTQNGQLLLEEGTFNQLGSNLMVYLKNRESPTVLDQLLVHDTRVPDQPVTWYARSGNISVDADGYPELILKHGVRQEVGPKQVGMLEFETYNLDIRQSLGQQMLEPRSKEMEEFSLRELLQAQKTDPSIKHRHEMAAEFHKRLLWPLSPIPLVLLAAAWLLRPPRRQQSSWRLLTAAGLSGVAYLGALLGLSGLSQTGAHWALYGQWLLPVIAIVAARWISCRGLAHG